jgi:hypothetical protein
MIILMSLIIVAAVLIQLALMRVRNDRQEQD